MIDRILEPEVMQSAEEALEYDSMDHEQVNQAFVNDLLQFLGVAPNPDFAEEDYLDILDIGTGTARIPVLLAKRLPQCRVMASDASTAMLDIAKINIDMDQVLDQVHLTKLDAKEMDYEDEYFHLVMSNSIVHHIPEPVDVLRESVRVTNAGGWLYFRDLLRPESDQELGQLVTQYCGKESERAQQLFSESLHAALTVSEMRDLVEGLGFDRQTVSQTSDRHWTWAASKPA